MRRWTLLLLALVWAACDNDPYYQITYPDGAPDMAADAEPVKDAAPDADACVPTPGGEVCDGKDNDCDGKVDDVDAKLLAQNLKHCGKCDNACSFPYA
ncbi:MAG: hypothetical protein QF464_24555, partial [Myxococcota bacterium]|nr:hypothetical protein [Myxococcota bacterium]